MNTPEIIKNHYILAVKNFRRYFPFLEWLLNYDRQNLIGDIMAGAIVAIMLVPQSMAYSLLAGLPPQVGLYASILPLILYPLFGSSRSLAVGPVAMVSLLVATAVGKLAARGTPEYIVLALTLAMLVGIIQLGMGLTRLGFLVNFLSHSVILGFTNAAALVIGFSQLKDLLGISFPQTEKFYPLLVSLSQRWQDTNLVTLGIGLLSIAILVYCQFFLEAQLKRSQISKTVIIILTKIAPFLVVLLGTILVWVLRLDQNAAVKIVGNIPRGLPGIAFPYFDLNIWQALLPVALTISFVGFMESIAIAKSLASKRRQKVDANQELIALGIANIGASFTGGYPVTGGLSRSLVNFSAGASTGLASIISALLISLTVVFLTPLFYFLPQTSLAAIIIVAVGNLIDLKAIKRNWKYNKADAISMLITFGGVLSLGIEMGIAVGTLTALILYIWRTSKPHIAVVGRVGDSEQFRNVLRHEVKTYPHVLAVRIDESLYFANTQYLEEYLLSAVADRPEIKHLVLICSAINFIDGSALETLENLVEELADAGVKVYLTEVKGPVMAGMEKVNFLDKLGSDRIFLSTHQAMQALGCD